jgi:hypothetical protein
MLRHGSAPGERRGGRAKGVPNKATADIKMLAQPYGAPAVAELARLAGIGDGPGAANEATRVAALRELLDRGFGRATTVLAGDGEAPPVVISFEWAKATSAVVTDAAADDLTPSDAPLTVEWKNSC